MTKDELKADQYLLAGWVLVGSVAAYEVTANKREIVKAIKVGAFRPFHCLFSLPESLLKSLEQLFVLIALAKLVSGKHALILRLCFVFLLWTHTPR